MISSLIVKHHQFYLIVVIVIIVNPLACPQCKLESVNSAVEDFLKTFFNNILRMTA